MPSRALLALFGFALALGAIAALVTRAALVRRSRSWRATRRSARASRGEAEAESLLTRAGWSVVGRQVHAHATYQVDGQRYDAGVRADLVVERDGTTRVAEVKTGRVAPRIDLPTTRRQLLEYAAAFDADGVLLVDAERGAVHEIVVPLRARSVAPAGWAVFVTGLLTGVLLVVGWIYGAPLLR